MNSQEAKKLLSVVVWEEGKIFPLLEGPYRYRIIVHCSERGRQRALFANGEHSYFCYVEIIDNNGQWIERGVGIVPVLPDGRFIMVVEQRPAQSRYPDCPMVAEVGGKKLNLNIFGEHSSLEFPGGAVDPNEGLKAGFLRELTEETGVEEQEAFYYNCLRPVYPLGSDLCLRQFIGVVFLSGLSYTKKVETDGGLNVLALTQAEVQRNIWKGVIHSGQAAILEWSFYHDVQRVRSDVGFKNRLLDSGYLMIERIKIAKTK